MKKWAKNFLTDRGWYIRKSAGLAYGVDFSLDIGRMIDPGSIKVVYDVGAHHGHFSRYLTDIFRSANVYSFEPISESFGALQRQAAAHPRIFPANMAMGASPREATVVLREDSQLNSLRGGHGGDDGGASEVVRVDSLDRVTQENGHAGIDVLKIDTEGYELEVLEGASELLSRRKISFIYVETTMREGDETHTYLPRLIDVLGTAGFRFVALYDQCVFDRSYSGFANALFRLVT